MHVRYEQAGRTFLPMCRRVCHCYVMTKCYFQVHNISQSYFSQISRLFSGMKRSKEPFWDEFLRSFLCEGPYPTYSWGRRPLMPCPRYCTMNSKLPSHRLRKTWAKKGVWDSRNLSLSILGFEVTPRERLWEIQGQSFPPINSLPPRLSQCNQV